MLTAFASSEDDIRRFSGLSEWTDQLAIHGDASGHFQSEFDAVLRCY
jgi:hypothetical protein